MWRTIWVLKGSKTFIIMIQQNQRWRLELCTMVVQNVRATEWGGLIQGPCGDLRSPPRERTPLRVVNCVMASLLFLKGKCPRRRLWKSQFVLELMSLSDKTEQATEWERGSARKMTGLSSVRSTAGTRDWAWSKPQSHRTAKQTVQTRWVNAGAAWVSHKELRYPHTVTPANICSPANGHCVSYIMSKDQDTQVN